MSIKADFEKKPEERVKACIEKAMRSLDEYPCPPLAEVRGKEYKYAYYVKSNINSKIRPNGKKGYPPKETLRRAYYLAYKKEYMGWLNGGEEANSILDDYGFKVYWVKGDKRYKLPGNKKSTTTNSKTTNKTRAAATSPKKTKVKNNLNDDKEAIKALEGELKERRVMSRGRNKGLADECKARDKYKCVVCNFSFKEEKEKIVECHHLEPLHMKKHPSKTTPEHLITLCPTCHRLAHHLIEDKGKGKKYTQRISLLKELKKIRM